MKRLALSIATAVAALGIGACEKNSSANLPERYQNKGGPHEEAASTKEAAPNHGAKEKTSAGEHEG